MSKVKKQPSFKAYAAMWIAIIAAYAVWMIAFMRKIVLVNYATVEERTVDGITHANISGMMGHEWLYPIWVAVSCICLAMFIVYIRVLLYGKEPGKALKIFCLFGVIFGCVYVTWYGFFGDQPFIEKVKFITASMICLDFPWHFRGWGIIASATVFTNTLYAYRKLVITAERALFSAQSEAPLSMSPSTARQWARRFISIPRAAWRIGQGRSCSRSAAPLPWCSCL